MNTTFNVKETQRRISENNDRFKNSMRSQTANNLKINLQELLPTRVISLNYVTFTALRYWTSQ